MQITHTRTNTNGFEPSKCKVILGTIKVTLQMVSNTFDYITKVLNFIS